MNNPKAEKTTEKIAQKIYENFLAKLSLGVSRITASKEMHSEWYEALDTERQRAEEAEKKLAKAIEDTDSVTGLGAKFPHLLEYLKQMESQITDLEVLVVELQSALRVAKAWIPNYTAPVEEKDGFLSDMNRVNKALSLTPKDIRSQLEECRELSEFRLRAEVSCKTQLLEAKKDIERISGFREGHPGMCCGLCNEQIQEAKEELKLWYKLHNQFVETLDGSKPDPEFLDDCFTDVQKENEAQKETIRKMRELVELAIGFSVAFREDNACWEKHQDVGILFAKLTTGLKNLSESTEGEGKENPNG